MFRGLILILVLLSAVSVYGDDEGIQGTLLIKKNVKDPSTTDKVFTIRAAINSAQYNNIVQQAIQVIVPTPNHACSAVQIPQDFKGLSGSHIPIYYLISGSNGECSYARKVENAKKALAKGAIIVDSPQGINNLRLRLQEKDLFVTLLISEKEGLQLIEKSTGFIAELTLGERSKTKKNQMEIWVSSLNADSYRTLHHWKDILADVSIFEQQLSWTPRFAFYSCDSGDTCKAGFVNSCACGGEFCSPQQHGSSSNILVREDIRQHLIFKSSPEKYLQYVKKFYSTCFQSYSKNLISDDCATTIMHDLELDSGINIKIDNFLTACEEQDDQTNFIIYKALALDRAKYAQIGHYPTVILNHQQLEFRGKEEFKTAVCRKLGLQQESGCGVVIESTTTFSKIVSGFFYFLLVTMLLGAGGFVVLFFRNRLRKDMNKELKMQVSTAVEHYFTLSEAQH